MIFPTNLSFIFLFLTSLSLSSHHYCIASELDNESSFSYTDGANNGPEKWSQADKTYQACNNGKLQSPIDLLNRSVEISPDLGKLKRSYKPAPAVVKNRGHDISAMWKGDAGKITINGTIYKLAQTHWHSPSEHTFNGTRYDLEMHIVHKNTSLPQERLAVIGILYKYGRPDPFLSELFHHIKAVEQKDEIDLGIISPGLIKFGSRKYYRYVGSLTVPPCTEGVVWTVLNKVRTASREQVRALREAVHDGYEENARPTQHSNEITVQLYSPKMKRGST